jgi:hypothetical protein
MDHLVMVVTLSVSSGAISAFSPNLPAFFALFVPATLPYFVSSVTSPDIVLRASCLLLLVFIPAMAGLAIIANGARLRDRLRRRPWQNGGRASNRTRIHGRPARPQRRACGRDPEGDRRRLGHRGR